MQLTVNLNDEVYVRLSQDGLVALRLFNRKFPRKEAYIYPAAKVGERLKFQLHQLMCIFGETCFCGGDTVFEGSSIEFFP